MINPAILIALSLPMPAKQAPTPLAATAAAATIGTATRRPDGTIVLRLRSAPDPETVAEAQFEYPVTHPDYAMIVRHVGIIPIGKEVGVRPFPEPGSKPHAAPDRRR